MTPVQIDLALSVIQLIGKSIQERLDQHNELVALFQKAREEGRDLTEEEVALYEQRAEQALQELENLMPTLDG